MPKTIEVNSTAQLDEMDFSRNNAERKPWGQQKSSEHFQLNDEYSEPKPEASLQTAPPPAPPADPPKPKFTHKLANGNTLEAESVEALASLIEKSFQQTPAPPPAEWDESPAYQPIQFKRSELTIQQQADILNLWKENPQKALRMLQEAEYGVSMDVLMQNLSRAEIRELNRREEEIGVEWIYENVDNYNPTPANGQLLTKYLREKNKPITKKNLTIAFNALKGDNPTMILKPQAAPPAEPDNTEEVPAPPVVVPSNQGGEMPPVTPQVDVEKFKRMSLDDQKKFFSKMRRGA